MPKFRTKIAHKPSSQIEVYGLVVKLEPDTDGICTFDVPDDRDDVIERLLGISEGFELVESESTGDDGNEVLSLIVTNGEGKQIDLYQADIDTLKAIGDELELTIHPRSGLPRVRQQVIDAVKAAAQG